MQILGTGLSGLVGSRIIELNPQHQFTDLSLDTGHNILKPETLNDIFKNTSADTVLHLAAFTDTNQAYQQTGDTAGLCYQLNVVGTQNIVNLCQKYNKYLIFISTDFVFDGKKAGEYVETDNPNPLDWYGQTKFLGEQSVQTINSSIVRIAYPYRSKFETKFDVVRKIKNRLENHETLNLFTDQITTPTFIDDIALGLGKMIGQKPQEIYHLVGSSSQSPYDMAILITKTFGLDQTLIQPSSLLDYLKTPGVRPYLVNSALSNQKFISEFGITPKTLVEGLTEIKTQF